MKHIFIVEAEAAEKSSTFLLGIAMAFSRQHLRPDAFFWTTLERSDEIYLRIEVQADHLEVQHLLKDFQAVAGVKFIALQREHESAVIISRPGFLQQRGDVPPAGNDGPH